MEFAEKDIRLKNYLLLINISENTSLLKLAITDTFPYIHEKIDQNNN